MGNIIDYVENKMESLNTNEFNAVDSLVLSVLSYIRFENIVPLLSERKTPVRIGELLKAEMFESMFHDLWDMESHRRILYAFAASPRFRNTYLNFYTSISDPVLDKQFSAVTFLLEDKTAYIAYRGTDSTFVGWKEDFNMAYMSTVPAQGEGVKYLNAVAKEVPDANKLRVGGHSKGGNIAVYSAVNCDPSVKKRIDMVYNHDGPGFKDNLFSSPEFLHIKDHIHTTMPEEALIGMLLQHHENYFVIQSSQHGVIQHDPFTWQVEHDDFCYAPKIKGGALIRSKTINEWLNSINDEKRKLFIDALFQLLCKTEYKSFREFSEEWQKGAITMLSTIKNSDPEIRRFVIKTMNELAQLSVKNLFRQNKE